MDDDIAAQVFIGIDLAWSTGTTGLAAVSESGRLLSSTSVQDDDEIARWIDQLPRPPRVVAVDAPLVVPNDTGQRLAERLIAQTFGRYGASAHSANRTLMGGEPRGTRLARRFGWTIDPHARPSDDQTVCIEVYPHPALIGLFRLPYRLTYKRKFPLGQRLAGFRQLADLLESVPELDLAATPRWTQVRQSVASPRPGDLNRYEDEIDAILCAHLAWLWQHRPEALHVYGSLDEGYIVAPTPPTHPAVKPEPPAPERPADTAVTGTPQPEQRQAPARPIAAGSAAQRLADDAAEVRAMLIDRIAQGTAPVTYGEVAAHVGRIPNGLGPLLDKVADLCAARGEPNLAVLVVNKSTGEPTKYADRPDYWQAEQQRCLAHA